MKALFLLLFTLTLQAQQSGADSLDLVVFVEYDDALRSEREAAVNTSFLKDFTEKFGKYYDNPFQYDRFTRLSVDALEMELFEQRAAQRKYLENAEVSEFLKKHLQEEVEFQYWHLLYAYPVIRANLDQKSRRLTSVPEEILKGFNREDLRESENLKYKAFRQLVPFYVSYENSRLRNFEKYTNRLLMVNEKVEFSVGHLKDEIADYSLARLLLENQQDLSRSLAQSTVSRIENEKIRERFTGEFLDKVVAREAEAVAEKTRQENVDITFYDRKGKPFDLSKFKGKVVYIDFWASWCGPCRIQFPYAKKLHESLPEKVKKEIVFLYISIDETVEKWEDGIRSNGLEDYVNGHVDGGWSAKVLSKLQIRSIPRYMLVDKNGKIVNANAPRPNQPEILPELLRLAE